MAQAQNLDVVVFVVVLRPAHSFVGSCFTNLDVPRTVAVLTFSHGEPGENSNTSSRIAASRTQSKPIDGS